MFVAQGCSLSSPYLLKEVEQAELGVQFSSGKKLQKYYLLMNLYIGVSDSIHAVINVGRRMIIGA